MFFMTKLIQNGQAIFGIISGFVALLIYFLGRKDGKSEAKIKQLDEGNKSIRKDIKHAVSIQKKQAEMASLPTPDRDTIHEQLLDLSRRTQK